MDEDKSAIGAANRLATGHQGVAIVGIPVDRDRLVATLIATFATPAWERTKVLRIGKQREELRIFVPTRSG